MGEGFDLTAVDLGIRGQIKAYLGTQERLSLLQHRNLLQARSTSCCNERRAPFRTCRARAPVRPVRGPYVRTNADRSNRGSPVATFAETRRPLRSRQQPASQAAGRTRAGTWLRSSHRGAMRASPRRPRRPGRAMPASTGHSSAPRPARRSTAPARGRRSRTTARRCAGTACRPQHRRVVAEQRQPGVRKERGGEADRLGQRRTRARRRSTRRAAHARAVRRRCRCRPSPPAARRSRTPAAPAGIRAATPCRSRRSPPGRSRPASAVAMPIARLVATVDDRRDHAHAQDVARTAASAAAAARSAAAAGRAPTTGTATSAMLPSA